jgi:hypothetical protein|tara:strand:+ start:463 stop:786 length:324 start_codon:yes stop_codon:yes gene_type:complete
MNNIRTISKENEINKLIKDQRFSGKREYILYTSLWDPVSTRITNLLKGNSPKISLSIVNSFDTPHSFVIWGVKKTPCLVVLEGRGRDKKLTVTDHVTDIYRRLRLEK